jgi:hypothetical protein
VKLVVDEAVLSKTTGSQRISESGNPSNMEHTPSRLLSHLPCCPPPRIHSRDRPKTVRTGTNTLSLPSSGNQPPTNGQPSPVPSNWQLNHNHPHNQTFPGYLARVTLLSVPGLRHAKVDGKLKAVAPRPTMMQNGQISAQTPTFASLFLDFDAKLQHHRRFALRKRHTESYLHNRPEPRGRGALKNPQPIKNLLAAHSFFVVFTSAFCLAPPMPHPPGKGLSPCSSAVPSRSTKANRFPGKSDLLLPALGSVLCHSLTMEGRGSQTPAPDRLKSVCRTDGELDYTGSKGTLLDFFRPTCSLAVMVLRNSVASAPEPGFSLPSHPRPTYALALIDGTVLHFAAMCVSAWTPLCLV